MIKILAKLNSLTSQTAKITLKEQYLGVEQEIVGHIYRVYQDGYVTPDDKFDPYWHDGYQRAWWVDMLVGRQNVRFRADRIVGAEVAE